MKNRLLDVSVHGQSVRKSQIETDSVSKCAIKVSLVIAIRATAGRSTVLGICSVLVTVARKRLALYVTTSTRLLMASCSNVTVTG